MVRPATNSPKNSAATAGLSVTPRNVMALRHPNKPPQNKTDQAHYKAICRDEDSERGWSYRRGWRRYCPQSPQREWNLYPEELRVFKEVNDIINI